MKAFKFEPFRSGCMAGADYGRPDAGIILAVKAVVQDRQPTPRKRFPWLALILLLGSIYLFWIYPYQMGDRPVEVEFERASQPNKQ